MTQVRIARLKLGLVRSNAGRIQRETTAVEKVSLPHAAVATFMLCCCSLASIFTAAIFPSLRLPYAIATLRWTGLKERIIDRRSIR